MRIGVILHGPEIVDTGSAKRIIELLQQENQVIAKLGGTMGRTAVLDAGLEEMIDISQGLTPSETITSLKDRIDLALLLNHGKTIETGRYFGQTIASRLDPSNSPPFVHVERPDCEGRIIYYCARAKHCAEYIRDTLSKHEETYNLPVERGKLVPSNVRYKGETVIRRISGAFPGENIRLDGIVIGEATREELEIVTRDGKVIELRGGKIKPHGLEKLEKRTINLFTAKVKTGNIRRSPHKPMIKPVMCEMLPVRKAAMIDHCAESTFELIKDANLVITVGDDTTAIAADILARLGVPIIGITDGDIDSVLENTVVPDGSVILRVKAGFDDIVGREVFEKLLEGKQRIEIEKSNEILPRILALAEKYVEEITYY